ncbi:MAG: hypothetical protein HYV33_05520 [Candidatus Kerfeldbacteria bacterium]|nr:hypothetical protein [Candidatus Kerfeldbacteria bacterium]
MAISAERFRRPLQQQVETSRAGRRSGENISADQLRNHLQNRNRAESLASSALLEDDVIDDLVDHANELGLKSSELAEVVAEIERHVTLRSNVEARHEFNQKKRSTSWYKLHRHIANRWHEAIEVFGQGLGTDVKERKASIIAHKSDMMALAKDALERQARKQRLEQYLELANDRNVAFRNLIERFQRGELELPELLANVDYRTGINKIVAELDFDNLLDIGEPGDPEYVNAADPNIKRAVENHLRFILRSEVAQLAQAQSVEVLSSTDYRHDQTKWGRVRRMVLLSGTVWGAATRLGINRLMIGGTLGAGLLAGGGGLAVAFGAGAAAGAVREYFNGKERKRQRRIDAAVGAGPAGIVRSASDINRDLAAVTQALQGVIGSGNSIEHTLEQSYAVIADVQNRLLRTRLAKGDERQDYISFGLDNRFKAQNDLLDNFQRAVMTFDQALERHNATSNTGQQDHLKQTLARIASTNLLTLKANEAHLKKHLEKGERAAIVRSAIVSGAFGGAAAMAMDALAATWPVTYLKEHLPWSKPPAPSLPHPTQLTVGGQSAVAEVSADGRITVFNQAHQVMTSSELPSNIDPNNLQVKADGSNLKLFDEQTGKPLGEMRITVDTVDAGETVMRAVEPTLVDLSPDKAFVVKLSDTLQYRLAVSAQGLLEVFKDNAGETVPVGQPIALLSEEIKAKLTDLHDKAAQFIIQQTDQNHVVIKSAFDGKPITTLALTDSGVTAAAPPPPPATPLTGGNFMERLFATPSIKVILEKMGLANAQDIQVSGSDFNIAPNAIQPGEYLDKAAKVATGWRQTRLELFLQAQQQGLINAAEDPAVVVARLERATRNILHDNGPHLDKSAALHEAFQGKDTAFIRSHELRFVDGSGAPDYVGVNQRWMQLVEQARAIREAAAVAAAPAPTGDTIVGDIVSTNPDVRLLLLQDIYQPVGTSRVLTELALASAADRWEAGLVDKLGASVILAGGILGEQMLGASAIADNNRSANHSEHIISTDEQVRAVNLDHPEAIAQAEQTDSQVETQAQPDLVAVQRLMTELQQHWQRNELTAEVRTKEHDAKDRLNKLRELYRIHCMATFSGVGSLRLQNGATLNDRLTAINQQTETHGRLLDQTICDRTTRLATAVTTAWQPLATDIQARLASGNGTLVEWQTLLANLRATALNPINDLHLDVTTVTQLPQFLNPPVYLAMQTQVTGLHAAITALEGQFASAVASYEAHDHALAELRHHFGDPFITALDAEIQQEATRTSHQFNRPARVVMYNFAVVQAQAVMRLHPGLGVGNELLEHLGLTDTSGRLATGAPLRRVLQGIIRGTPNVLVTINQERQQGQAVEQEVNRIKQIFGDNFFTALAAAVQASEVATGRNYTAAERLGMYHLAIVQARTVLAAQTGMQLGVEFLQHVGLVDVRGQLVPTRVRQVCAGIMATAADIFALPTAAGAGPAAAAGAAPGAPVPPHPPQAAPNPAELARQALERRVATAPVGNAAQQAELQDLGRQFNQLQAIVGQAFMGRFETTIQGIEHQRQQSIPNSEITAMLRHALQAITTYRLSGNRTVSQATRGEFFQAIGVHQADGTDNPAVWQRLMYDIIDRQPNIFDLGVPTNPAERIRQLGGQLEQVLGERFSNDLQAAIRTAETDANVPFTDNVVVEMLDNLLQQLRNFRLADGSTVTADNNMDFFAEVRIVDRLGRLQRRRLQDIFTRIIQRSASIFELKKTPAELRSEINHLRDVVGTTFGESFRDQLMLALTGAAPELESQRNALLAFIGSWNRHLVGPRGLALTAATPDQRVAVLADDVSAMVARAVNFERDIIQLIPETTDPTTAIIEDLRTSFDFDDSFFTPLLASLRTHLSNPDKQAAAMRRLVNTVRALRVSLQWQPLRNVALDLPLLAALGLVDSATHLVNEAEVTAMAERLAKNQKPLFRMDIAFHTPEEQLQLDRQLSELRDLYGNVFVRGFTEAMTTRGLTLSQQLAVLEYFRTQVADALTTIPAAEFNGHTITDLATVSEANIIAGADTIVKQCVADLAQTTVANPVASGAPSPSERTPITTEQVAAATALVSRLNTEVLQPANEVFVQIGEVKKHCENADSAASRVSDDTTRTVEQGLKQRLVALQATLNTVQTAMPDELKRAPVRNPSGRGFTDPASFAALCQRELDNRSYVLNGALKARLRWFIAHVEVPKIPKKPPLDVAGAQAYRTVLTDTIEPRLALIQADGKVLELPPADARASEQAQRDYNKLIGAINGFRQVLDGFFRAQVDLPERLASKQERITKIFGDKLGKDITHRITTLVANPVDQIRIIDHLLNERRLNRNLVDRRFEQDLGIATGLVEDDTPNTERLTEIVERANRGEANIYRDSGEAEPTGAELERHNQLAQAMRVIVRNFGGTFTDFIFARLLDLPNELLQAPQAQTLAQAVQELHATVQPAATENIGVAVQRASGLVSAEHQFSNERLGTVLTNIKNGKTLAADVFDYPIDLGKKSGRSGRSSAAGARPWVTEAPRVVVAAGVDEHKGLGNLAELFNGEQAKVNALPEFIDLRTMLNHPALIEALRVGLVHVKETRRKPNLDSLQLALSPDNNAGRTVADTLKAVGLVQANDEPYQPAVAALLTTLGKKPNQVNLKTILRDLPQPPAEPVPAPAPAAVAVEEPAATPAIPIKKGRVKAKTRVDEPVVQDVNKPARKSRKPIVAEALAAEPVEAPAAAAPAEIQAAVPIADEAASAAETPAPVEEAVVPVAEPVAVEPDALKAEAKQWVKFGNLGKQVPDWIKSPAVVTALREALTNEGVFIKPIVTKLRDGLRDDDRAKALRGPALVAAFHLDTPAGMATLVERLKNKAIQAKQLFEFPG